MRHQDGNRKEAQQRSRQAISFACRVTTTSKTSHRGGGSHYVRMVGSPNGNKTLRFWFICYDHRLGGRGGGRSGRTKQDKVSAKGRNQLSRTCFIYGICMCKKKEEVSSEAKHKKTKTQQKKIEKRENMDVSKSYQFIYWSGDGNKHRRPEKKKNETNTASRDVYGAEEGKAEK